MVIALKNLALLSLWHPLRCVYKPQEAQVLIHLKRFEHASGDVIGLVKDYNYDMHYYPSKANKVIDAHSRNLTRIAISIIALPNELQKEFDMGDN